MKLTFKYLMATLICPLLFAFGVKTRLDHKLRYTEVKIYDNRVELKLFVSERFIERAAEKCPYIKITNLNEVEHHVYTSSSDNFQSTYVVIRPNMSGLMNYELADKQIDESYLKLIIDNY